jgi:hypothetical protein
MQNLSLQAVKAQKKSWRNEVKDKAAYIFLVGAFHISPIPFKNTILLIPF